METFFFTLLFCLFLLVGLFIMLTNNPVHAILALVLIFFLSSCLTLGLGAEFLAILILIVYVGAISVLFLFVVMLLNVRVLELNVSLLKYWWLGAMYIAFFFFNLTYAWMPVLKTQSLLAPTFGDLVYQTYEWNSVAQFGELVFLYHPHLLGVATLVLFVAIVSPVLLSFISYPRTNKISNETLLINSRKQDIFLQTLRASVEKNF